MLLPVLSSTLPRYRTLPKEAPIIEVLLCARSATAGLQRPVNPLMRVRGPLLASSTVQQCGACVRVTEDNARRRPPCRLS